ncbi:hypothetical protein [Phenylobacterium sp.]|uniref:hypothetical protein n=1 Tax=Phenylobacterium sp. TaxID=1871053 RepID=UPI002DF29480|nr:hypothetical protein [Phenylobacterium sp.]
MRTPIRIGLSAAAMSLAALTASAKPQPRPAAPSAGSYGVEASYRTATPGRGYSARDRHIADCLATYRGRYNPHTDRVAMRDGASRRCGF